MVDVLKFCGSCQEILDNWTFSLWGNVLKQNYCVYGFSVDLNKKVLGKSWLEKDVDFLVFSLINCLAIYLIFLQNSELCKTIKSDSAEKYKKVLKIAAYANFERWKTGWPRKLFLLPANPEIEPVAGWLRSCTKDFVFLYSMRWFYYERSWMRNEVSRDEVF